MSEGSGLSRDTRLDPEEGKLRLVRGSLGRVETA